MLDIYFILKEGLLAETAKALTPERSSTKLDHWVLSGSEMQWSWGLILPKLPAGCLIGCSAYHCHPSYHLCCYCNASLVYTPSPCKALTRCVIDLFQTVCLANIICQLGLLYFRYVVLFSWQRWKGNIKPNDHDLLILLGIFPPWI